MDGKHMTEIASSRQLSTLKCAIVGAGLMGRWHAAAVKRVGCDVAAVIDTDRERAHKLASSIGRIAVFHNLEDAIAKIQFDVLHVCTPSITHVPLVDMAASRAIHIVVEKPLAPTSAETKNLLGIAKSAGILICPVHQFLFQNGVRQALRSIHRIGRIVHLDATFCSAGAQHCAPEDWDRIPADIIPHPLSLMQRFVSGGISNMQWTVTRPSFGEWRVSGLSDGISASIFISMSARPTRAGLTIHGTLGTLHCDLFHGFSYFETGRASRGSKIVRPFSTVAKTLGAATTNLTRRVILRDTAYPGLRYLIREFYAAIASGTNSPISPEEIIAVANARDRLVSESVPLVQAQIRQAASWI